MGIRRKKEKKKEMKNDKSYPLTPLQIPHKA